MLPEEIKVTPLPYFTPTKWQTVLLRTYGLVAVDALARALKTDEKTVILEAKRLGIDQIQFSPKWKNQGYITVLKSLWHLLPYGQILTLLEMDEKTLDYNLREDDFLGVKLGLTKSYSEEVYYSPLSDEEITKTNRIAELIKGEFIPLYAQPFDFYPTEEKSCSEPKAASRGFDKIVYNYSTLYGDTFGGDDEIVSDEALEKMQAVGVTGLWMQGVLSKLSPYPFVKNMDEGYEKRRENLSNLVKKCKKYGIGVFLYLNEPRGISADQLTEQTEKIKGRFFEERWSLCTTTEPVRSYLYEAVKGLVTAVPDLAGIITITMSENMTNCHSRPNNPCPFCSKLKHSEVVPEVNNIMQRAVTDAGVKTRIIANLWGWTAQYEWSDAEVLEGIAKMDEKIDVLSVSELGRVISGGETKIINEYSLSNPGPCEETKRNLTEAKRLGHKIMAKVQVNNSWEMAIVPYVPVFDLVIEHIKRLKALGVDGLMLSWTLGGYPTVVIDLVDAIFSDNFDYDEWLKSKFSNNSAAVKQAVSLFSEGFAHFPFCMDTLYKGAQHCGPINLLYPEKTGFKATMVAFPFDDVDSWRGSFTPEEFDKKLTALLSLWGKGLHVLENLSGNAELDTLRRYAETVFVCLKSMLTQFRFNNERAGDRTRLLALTEEEERLTKALYRLASSDSRIGYEASNHYYFTQNGFLEKLVNLDYIKSRLNK